MIIVTGVGSGVSRIIPPLHGPFAAAKADMDAFAEATSNEVRAYGTDTTIVMPGPSFVGSLAACHCQTRQLT